MLEYNIIDDKVKLSWQSIPGATKYKVYKKILEYNNDYRILANISTCSYTDLIANEGIIYPPEILIESEREYGLINVSFLDNIKNKRTIEYFS